MNIRKFADMDRYGSLYAGLMFLAFTIAFGVQFSDIRITTIGVIHSAFFPGVILISLGSLSLIHIALSIWELMKTPRTEQTETKAEDKKDYLCVLSTLIICILYVGTLERLGFVIASAIFIFAQALNLAPKTERKPIKFGIIAIIASVAIYSFFRYVLNLMLPMGLLTGIF
ncbi:MAG: tripartite tricarboxylate transporter TctB family protein [Oscillospiraceae bacterium]|nr:tripartite tricarboxylate transporter TctB family protein [Oscillospiraceae bacterium]